MNDFIKVHFSKYSLATYDALMARTPYLPQVSGPEVIEFFVFKLDSTEHEILSC